MFNVLYFLRAGRKIIDVTFTYDNATIYNILTRPCM